MNVLVVCEFSGIVREAFKEKGHNAISVDLLPTEILGKHSISNIKDCPNDILAKFDLAICFPPCTYLCVSGAQWWPWRYKEQQEALDFVKWLMNMPIFKIAIENPIGKISTVIRKPDQIIQPWMFGHPETKATCLWLKNLPKLVPTNIVNEKYDRVHQLGPSENRWKERSRTLVGIAKAMAEQWG